MKHSSITLAKLEVGKKYTCTSNNGNTLTTTILRVEKRGNRYKVDTSLSHYHLERNELTQKMRLGRKYLLGDQSLFEFYNGHYLINAKI